MKPHHKIFLIALALLLVVINAHCQTKMTEGRIVYKLNNIESIDKKLFDTDIDSEKIFSFKGFKQRLDLLPTDSVANCIIYNDSLQQTISLGYFLNKITALVQSYNSSYKQNLKLPVKTYKYLNESKIICGYKYFKAEYKIDGDTGNYYLYYTKDILDSIPFYVKDYLMGLDGFPMEYNEEISWGYLIYAVTNVSKGKIDDNIFLIPMGYRYLNADNWDK